MGSMIDLPETARNAALVAELIESTRRVERLDVLLAVARYLNFKGEHAAAELLRTELDVFRFMRSRPRVDEQSTESPLPSFLRVQVE